METDPNLETHAESRAETWEERTNTPASLSLTPTGLTPAPPQASSSGPSKLSPAPATILSLTHPTMSSPTTNHPKLTPTSSSPSLTCRTLPYVSPALLTQAFTTPPSVSADPVATASRTPTHPTLLHPLPAASHAPPPSSPTRKKPGPAPALLSCPDISAVTSPPFSSNSNVNSPPGASPFLLTNGNARTAPTPTSPPITPFHTPAGRQVPHTLGTSRLPQDNLSASPVRQRVSRQALLLGRGPCSSRDQMLLRAQMLQSLTLHPSDPPTLTIPPSLRLKPPSSAPVSRPCTPIFPPLRPRPQSGTVETDRQATPTRHLSVPPPTLYPSVRSVPLRPRLHSPNGHRVVPPRHSPTLRPIPAAADHLALPSRHWTGPASSLSSQATPKQSAPGQSQLSSCSRPAPLGTTSCFDRLPPASRQLQIIALSAGSTSHLSSQSRFTADAHPPSSVQSKHLALECSPTQLDAHQQRTLDHASPPSTSSPNGANTPLPSTSSLLQAELKEEGEKQAGEKPLTGAEEGTVGDEETQCEMTGIEEEGQQRIKMEEEQRKRLEVEEEQRKRLEVEEEQRRSLEVEEKQRKRLEVEEEQRRRLDVEEEQRRRVEVVEEEQRRSLAVEQRRMLEVEEEQRRMLEVEEEQRRMLEVEEEQRRRLEVEEEQIKEAAVKGDEGRTTAYPASPLDPQPSGDPAPQNHRSLDALHNSSTQIYTSSSSELPMDLQTPPAFPLEPPSDLPHLGQQDLCEDMSTQSDNQSVLSSLSSQSAPTSPFLTPPSDLPPPLLPVSPSQPETLSVPHGRPDTLSLSQREPWKQRAWPEGERRVLTHLVEGFVIREGLQAFPMTRSSLLLGEQKGVSQNLLVEGAGLLPFTNTPVPPEHSSESEQERTSLDDPLTAPSERQRGTLQCESCGKRGHSHSFHRSKRHCSSSCAHRYNVGLSKRLRALSAGSRPEGRSTEVNKEESVREKPLLLRLPREIWSARRQEAGEHAVPMTTRLERRAARRARRGSEPVMTPANPPVTNADPPLAQWSVEQVWGFIHTLPGCKEVAEAFRVQEIDGQALLLLTEDHLMTSMNIKLGPALKICAHINALRHR